jgi:ubiquinone/menaquinone biosynthesis C-methylase UbiE
VGKVQFNLVTRSEIEASYDRVAQEFADEFFGELARKPFDCQLLDEYAEMLGGKGRVCEIGCGPGQIARYLKDRGTNMCGVDLSQQMVEHARRLNSDITFEKGDMRQLTSFPDASLAGVVLFYSIIHLKREDVPSALKELYRVLEPGGKALISFHGGEGELHRDEWYEKPVSIDVTLFEAPEMATFLESARFTVERMFERKPYDFEYPTPRMYVLARTNPRRVT